MAVVGKERIAAILRYYSALPDVEQPAYLNRIRATFQVTQAATDQQILSALQDFVTNG